MLALGDPHNFGQRVHRRNDCTIVKPRNMVWEWLLLNTSSPLRQYLHRASSDSQRKNPAQLFPDLTYSDKALHEGGTVEFLETQQPLLQVCSCETFAAIGRAIGLMAWLGITDLHNGNMIFGQSAKHGLVLCPIDVETVLFNYDLLTQSFLLPSAQCPHDHCGLTSLHNWIAHCTPSDSDYIPAICYGYLDALDLLSTHEQQLYDIFLNLNRLTTLPIRILLRNTREYHQLLLNTHLERLAPKPLSHELEQLERKDIPYYFRHINSPTILYYQTIDSIATARIPDEMQKYISADARTLCNGDIPTRSIDRLAKAGVLQLAKFFIDEQMTGSSSYDELSIQLTPNDIRLTYCNSLSLQCSR